MFQTVTNSNFMSPQNTESIRTKHNIPDDVQCVTYFIGDGKENAMNAFGSTESPQPLKNHIQCVSKVKVRLASTFILETSALLDTGSILNFVSKGLIERMGSPKPAGTWQGTSKTV